MFLPNGYPILVLTFWVGGDNKNIVVQFLRFLSFPFALRKMYLTFVHPNSREGKWVSIGLLIVNSFVAKQNELLWTVGKRR